MPFGQPTHGVTNLDFRARRALAEAEDAEIDSIGGAERYCLDYRSRDRGEQQEGEGDEQQH